MKLSLLSLAILSLSTSVQAANLEGLFLSPTTTWVFTDKAECDDAKGTFESIDGEERGICYFETQNTVEVKKSADAYQMEVTTWGGNTHSCYYEGKATLVEGKLVSETKVDDLDEGKNTCKLTLTYGDENTLSVSEEGDACRWFCGARGPGLSIDKAMRK